MKRFRNRVAAGALARRLGGPAPVFPLLTSIPGCQLWLDGADATTITLSGSTVTQWRDKSSNATVFTTSSGPALQTNAQNGKSIVSFTGQTMTGTGSSPAGSTGATIFLVAQQTNSSISASTGQNQIFGYADLGWGNFGAGIYQNGITWRFGSGSSQGQNTNTTVTIGSGYAMAVVNKNGATETALLNGRQVYTTSAMGPSIANTGSAITLGSGTQGTFSQNVAEIITYYYLLTTTQRQQVEGYLAWKWGVQASLPADHPYKSAAP